MNDAATQESSECFTSQLSLWVSRSVAIKNLLKDVERSVDKLPLSAEDIVKLVQQHLASKNTARLPVLMVAAAYTCAEKNLGETVLHIHAHNAADKQTEAAGDLEITLVGDDDVVTAYEMKMKTVTKGDVNNAIEKIRKERRPSSTTFSLPRTR